jgi:F0F1-type ATP synthase membrane subunit c/vacuolar-type H+-ATPase subunit K
MTRSEIAVKGLRIVHAALIVSVVLYAFVAEKVFQRSASSPERSFVTSITILAVAMICIALVIRSRMVNPAKQKLELDASDSGALNRWRMGTLISLVLIESVALYGLVLRVMGSTRSQTWPFYLTAILIMVIWTPSLDLDSPGSP